MDTYLVLNKNLHNDIYSRNYFVDADIWEKPFLGKIKKLNLFIGQNNSGKSNFLRGLAKAQNANYISDATNFIKRIQHCKTHLDKIIEVKQQFNFTFNLANALSNENDFTKIAHKIENVKGIITKKHTTESLFNEIKIFLDDLLEHLDFDKFQSNLKLYIGVVEILQQILRYSPSKTGNQYVIYDTSNILNPFLLSTQISELQTLLSEFEVLTITNIPLSHPKVFIPVLRSCHPLYSKDTKDNICELKEDVLYFSFVQNYEFDTVMESDPDLLIFTGFDLYDEISKNRNGDNDMRLNHRQFELFIGSTFYSTTSLEIVAKYPVKGENKIILVTIDEERPMHKIGDGIQALFILLYPIFTAKNNTEIFIEEPELNLHPGMQRLFLQTLANYPFLKSKGLRYFITTHSNHLIDLTLEDVENKAIFQFKKVINLNETCFQIKPILNRDTEVLLDLGVNNTSVFISNCAIWVEGITDRLYIKKYLTETLINKNLESKYKEDIHFSFFEYGGSLIHHYLFCDPATVEGEIAKSSNKINAISINTKIMVISDKDENKDKKHKYFLEQSNGNGFVYNILPVREIENLLSPEILRMSLPKIHTAFKNYIDKIELNENEYQSLNLSTSRTKVKSPRMGYYLKKQFEKASIPFPANILLKDSLTSYYKLKLAESSTQVITYANMSQKSKAVAEEIFDFIAKSNP